jgi:hypothetical protein
MMVEGVIVMNVRHRNKRKNKRDLWSQYQQGNPFKN